MLIEFAKFILCPVIKWFTFSDAAMKTASRHFRASYWFHTVLFRGINMVLNNVYAARKMLGIQGKNLVAYL